ncbi:MAG: tripartite tricarboxylate transporter TctB family protein [Aminivibrio sp.]|jgi:hypothetical protein
MKAFLSPRAGNIRDGVFFLALSAFLGRHGYALHDGGQWSLSPALFPVILSSGLAVLSLILMGQGVLRTRSERGEGEGMGEPALSFGRTALVFSLCLLYGSVLPFGGFIPTTTLFLALFCLLTGERRPLMVAAVSVLSPLAVWLVFSWGLSVILP